MSERPSPGLLQGLLAAAQTLTIIPLGAPRRRAGQLPWYGAVGFFIGAALWLGAWILPADAAPGALALVLLWGLASGFLHLDGLADCADGLMSGARGQRCLQIMRDPRCGSGGIIALVLALLGKVLLLGHLGLSVALILVPMLARATAALLFCTCKYVGAGSGGGLMRPGDAHLIVLAALACWMLAWILLPGATALLWGLVALLLFVVWAHLWVQRIKGFTGDCAGALIELLELALLACALL